MPTKRAILAELSADELRAGVGLYDLEVDDRRVKAHLADALAKSRKARVDAMLERLPRNRLKALCRVLNLDDSGVRKSDLVTRLTGTSGGPKAATAPGSTRKSNGGEGARQRTEAREAVIAWFRRHASERLPERVQAWRSKIGVPMPPVIVSDQQKRWGSCDRNGTIRLN